MRKRTKEENAEYSRLLRARKRSTLVAPNEKRSTLSVAPVAPDASLAIIKRLTREIEKLRLRIKILEGRGKKEDNDSSLYDRVMAAKVSRLIGT